VTRFFRLVAAETWGEGRFRLFGNKHVATAVGLGVPWAFAVSGSWWALWLYFGGANQLLAGLAIMLISIHLARVRAPTKYSLIPGIFMIVTTLAALLWQTWTFVYSVSLYLQGDKSWVVRNVRGPIQTDPNYILVAVVINGVFVLVGALLFLVGVSMAIRLFRSYRSSVAEARAPVAADGGTPKE
jgi:carbon starvation protein